MEDVPQTMLQRGRAAFIQALLRGELTVDADGIPSIADKGSAISKGIARVLLAKLGETVEREKVSGQTAGKSFESAVADFLRATFLHLTHLRPGHFEILGGGRRAQARISNFQQYHHLLKLSEKAKGDPDLRAALGGDYFIEPDVVVLRSAEPDEFLNGNGWVVNAAVANLTPLRSANPSSAPGRLLHASISCKWTLRSDRSQNARTEALNLIRNRNGRVPHIVVITAEPMPKRIASIAQGTSDLDCVYHIALPELRTAVAESLEGCRSEQAEDLEMLIAANRLRDISDLPLDLVI